MMNSIAFIPDGNRRYAVNYGITLAQAYAMGFDKAYDVVHWCVDSGIHDITIWALSTENMARNGVEHALFMRLLKRKLDDLMVNKELHENEMNVKIGGDFSQLPSALVKTIQDVEKRTAGYTKNALNLAINYGGKKEITDAVSRLVKAGKDITEANIQSELYFNHSPDFIIRTGNTQRLSGFMPWQSAYSELYFSKKLWPEFDRKEFDKAVAEYEGRERRFGK